jgi:predicted ester cyclase
VAAADAGNNTDARTPEIAGGMEVLGNEGFIRRFYEEVINERLLDETLSSEELGKRYFTDSFVHAVLSEGLADYWPDAAHVESMLDGAFPDARYTLEDVIASEDKVVARWVARGTHQTTGRWLRWEGVSIFALEGGRISRVWSFSDEFHLLRQLGVVVRLEDALDGGGPRASH